MVVQNYVREIRRSKKLSQKELAMALGVSRQTINAIETGKYNPSLELALEMERYFDVAFHELFKLEGI